MKYFLAVCCFVQFHVAGQYIRHTSEINDTASKSCFLQYENDLFVHTDRYYSQGIALGYKTSISVESRLNRLFFKVPAGKKRLGLGLNQQVYYFDSIGFVAGSRPALCGN